MIFLSGTIACDGNDSDWSLNEGNGERTFTRRITFKSAFSNVPMVTVGLTGLDVSSGPTKIYVGAANIDATGFDLEVKTWADTRVWAAVVNWLTIGL